jgi:hypothetical protein
MEHKVESFEIAGRIEMLVGWDETIEKDTYTEECHGVHEITTISVKQELTSVEIVIGNSSSIDILGYLNAYQRQEIIDNLPL